MDSELRRRVNLALRGGGYGDNLLAAFYGTTGNLRFVDSNNGSTSWDGKSADRACASLDQAFSEVTASQGDQIIVMPGHAETLSAAAGVAADVQGVDVIGLGRGTDRPTFTLDDTAADIDIDAANIGFENMVFINDVDEIVAPIDVNAAHFEMRRCTLWDATAAKGTLDWVVADANADFMKMIEVLHLGTDTASPQSVWNVGAAQGVEIVGCRSNGNLAVGNIELTGAAIDIFVAANYLENSNAVDQCIKGFAAATGWLAFNMMRIATDGQLTAIGTPGALSGFENYQVNADGETGILELTPSS